MSQPEPSPATPPPLLDPLLPNSTAPRALWGQLYGAALALVLAEAARRHDGPVLVIAASTREAERLAGELAFFAAGSLPVAVLPDYETLPYDVFSPHPDITSQRLATLAGLPEFRRGLLVASLDAALQRLPPRSYVEAYSLVLATGTALDLEGFRARLAAAGYASVTQVVAPGEFAVRGGLLDVWPMGSAQPYRIDLFDDEVDSIRLFDPETQRSGEKLARIRLLPAREFALTPEAIKDFRRRYRQRFEGDVTRSLVYKSVSDGFPTGGIEYYLPLFHESVATLFDYLPAGPLVVDTAGLDDAAPRAWADIGERHEQRRHDIERPLLDPAEVFLPPDELAARVAAGPHVLASRTKVEPIGAAQAETPFRNYPVAPPPSLKLDPRATVPAGELLRFLDGFDGRVLLIAESAGRREVLLELARKHDRYPKALDGWAEFAGGRAKLGLAVSPAVGGLLLPEAGLALIAEEQLYGERARQERRRKRAERDPEQILRELRDLTIGAPVVHEDHGVGRYQGLKTLDVDGQPHEFLVIEYADGDKLYVPVMALARITRYTGGPPESAPLHKLGGQEWQKARKKAAQRIRDVAAELLDLYARRAARLGTPMAAAEKEYAAFEAAFPFEETHDQQEAIRAVLADLATGKPMDRVVCGDVGFGKTEVALRAAFVAVQAGKQVAVLVPTTLLAQQHFQTFQDRFADWPIKVESLSRFRSQKQANEVLKGLEAGGIDVVVATHRLLQGDVKFRDLGLIIVDEEHRFGVRDKERLKKLRADVDVLTLTATPIPRTLNMSLGGLRDLSLITTPPAERLAVQTFVIEWNAPTIREAILREIRRGGQVYFVHNTVETIEKRADEIRALVPEAEVRVGHGQMRERDLEQLMLDFYHRRFTVLMCTTIVESGIDVPTANTIVIDRADRFGLAQLHQLRGRVGRSRHRAYAYLLAPPKAALTGDAKKRLEAIESLEDLGAGFTLATHDLEIRGAGELLGEEQSGQITEIGFSLYLDLLERAVKALKEGKEPDLEKPLHSGPELDLHVPTLIPEDYMPDVHLRLVLYKRISAAPDAEALGELEAEMIDRFGPLQAPTQHLFRITRLKLRAARLGLKRLEVGPLGGLVEFGEQHSVDPKVVLKLVQKEPKTWRLDGPSKLRFSGRHETEEARCKAADALLGQLGAP
ncbi:MAG: transcription-repair coupling factor [Steroidobacteraceae bacterium]|nr:transcription-repair coupling factor [Steroidobacteraceae bacterium]